MIKYLRKKSKYFYDILTILSGTMIAQAIPIAISPILTRIYTPEDFGLFSIYIALVSLISVIATGRFELAIMIPDKENEAFHITILSIIIAMFVSFCLFVFIVIFNQNLVDVIENPKIGPWLYLLPLSVMVTGLYQSFNYWHNRNKRYLNISKNRIIQSGGITTTQVCLGIIIKNIGLIIGQLAGYLLSLFYYIKIYLSNDHGKHLVNQKKLKELAIRYKKFPLIDVPTTFINIAANQGPNLLLGTLFTAKVAGFYYLTQKILQAPITLISRSVLDVFKQKASKDYKQLGNCRVVFKQTFWFLFSISLPSSVILFLCIEDLFAIFFGEPWRESGVYAKILIPAMFFRFIANPLSFMFYITEKQIYNFFGMLALLISIGFSLFFSSDKLQAIHGISYSLSIVYILYILMSARFAKVL